MAKYEKWLKEENLILLEGWRRSGLTIEQIAKDKIGINPCTLYAWINRFPEISEVLKKGREFVDFVVENSFFKKCTGYTYYETTYEYGWDPEKEEYIKIPVKTVERHMPADTAAIIFWMKNRKSKDWSDKPQLVDINDNKVELNIIFPDEN